MGLREYCVMGWKCGSCERWWFLNKALTLAITTVIEAHVYVIISGVRWSIPYDKQDYCIGSKDAWLVNKMVICLSTHLKRIKFSFVDCIH